MKTLNKDLAALQLTQVIEQLEDYDTEAMVNIYNQYADTMNYERINDNDEYTINDLYNNPYDALLAASYGDYNPNHDYFTYDGYNNLSSFNFTEDDNCPIDISEIAQWIVNNELYNNFDLTVTTLDDMLASVEDNIADDEMLLNTVCEYLHLNHITLGNDYSFDEKVNIVMELINGFNYEQLNKLITDLNINYQ